MFASSFSMTAQTELFECDDFQVVVNLLKFKLPCLGGEGTDIVLSFFDIDSTFENSTITAIDNINGSDTLSGNLIIDGGYGVIVFDFIYPTYSGNFDYTFIIEDNEDCMVQYSGYLETDYFDTDIMSFTNFNTTIDKPVIDYKINDVPSQYMNFTFEGGIVIFNELDTTLSYYPPNNFSGVDGFYYWQNSEYVSEDYSYDYQGLRRTNIFVNEDKSHLKLLASSFDSDETFLYFRGQPNYTYLINNQEEITSDDDGFLILARPQNPFSPTDFTVTNPNDSLDFISTSELYHTIYYDCPEAYSLYYASNLDTISMNTDSIELVNQSSPFIWSYCGEETFQGVFANDTFTIANTCIENLQNGAYYNSFYPLWTNTTSPNHFYQSMPINVKILLEGAYTQNGIMTSPYYEEGLLPLTQPYTGYPWYYKATDSLTASAPNVIDWVLVELRKGIPSFSEQNTATIERKAGILLDNGDIVSPNDLSSPLVFDKVLPEEEYYITVRHRNHLDVFSSTPIVANESLTYDFTQDPASALGTAQLKDLGDGFYGLFAGDFQADATIQVTDYDVWFINPAIINIYAPGDGNLDGVIQVTDFDTWFANKAKVGIGEVRF